MIKQFGKSAFTQELFLELYLKGPKNRKFQRYSVSLPFTNLWTMNHSPLHQSTDSQSPSPPPIYGLSASLPSTNLLTLSLPPLHQSMDSQLPSPPPIYGISTSLLSTNLRTQPPPSPVYGLSLPPSTTLRTPLPALPTNLRTPSSLGQCDLQPHASEDDIIYHHSTPLGQVSP